MLPTRPHHPPAAGGSCNLRCVSRPTGSLGSGWTGKLMYEPPWEEGPSSMLAVIVIAVVVALLLAMLVAGGRRAARVRARTDLGARRGRRPLVPLPRRGEPAERLLGGRAASADLARGRSGRLVRELRDAPGKGQGRRAGARERDGSRSWRPGKGRGRLGHGPGRLWPWPRRPGMWGVARDRHASATGSSREGHGSVTDVATSSQRRVGSPRFRACCPTVTDALSTLTPL